MLRSCMNRIPYSFDHRMLPNRTAWRRYRPHLAYLNKEVDKIENCFELKFVKGMQERGHYDFMRPAIVLQNKYAE